MEKQKKKTEPPHSSDELINQTITIRIIIGLLPVDILIFLTFSKSRTGALFMK